MLEKEDEMREFILDVETLPMNELEAKYPIQCYFQKEKIERWKLDHILPIIWNGELPTKNYWIWGKPGTGKSKWVHEQTELVHIYPKPVNKWRGGYNPNVHTIVSIEDYPDGTSGQCLAQYVKIWADRFTFQAEIKGGGIMVNPGKYMLLVTSNYSNDDIFNQRDAEAIKRRFKEIEIVDKNDIFLETRLDLSILS